MYIQTMHMNYRAIIQRNKTILVHPIRSYPLAGKSAAVTPWHCNTTLTDIRCSIIFKVCRCYSRQDRPCHIIYTSLYPRRGRGLVNYLTSVRFPHWLHNSLGHFCVNHSDAQIDRSTKFQCVRIMQELVELGLASETSSTTHQWTNMVK